MDEQEVARLLRARAQAWRGARGRVEESAWARQAPPRHHRWRWLPAATAVGAGALLATGAVAYGAGPAPVRAVLAPVGDRVSHPWHAEPQENPLPSLSHNDDGTNQKVVTPSGGHGPRAIATTPPKKEHTTIASPHPEASESPKDDARAGSAGDDHLATPTAAPHRDD
jgi:hypothetical protein